MRRTARIALALLVCLCVHGHAADFTEDISDALKRLNHRDADVALRPERWDTRLAFPWTESLLREPTQIPRRLEPALDSLRSAQTLSTLLHLADSLSETFAEPSPSSSRRTRPLVLPKKLGRPVEQILRAVEEAQLSLNKAVASLTPQERTTLLDVWQGVLKANTDVDPTPGLSSAGKFDRPALQAAGYHLAQAIENALPDLAAYAKESTHTTRSRLRAGKEWVVISGMHDDLYTADDLKDVVLLIDFGGANRYNAPPAGAHSGEIRLVIDFGEAVTVDASSSTYCAGAGAFGIGLFYLPSPTGHHVIRCGDFSEGAGVFGIGGMMLSGSAQVDARDVAQGAAAFGTGLLLHEHAMDSAYRVAISGQGFGSTQGIGIFSLQGTSTTITGGITYPDSREELAYLSQSQGVGAGPRAYAAGGIGLFALQGDHLRTQSSYFAQGSGYWHGLGAMILDGQSNDLQARRYSQGAGVHTAIGYLQIHGNENEVVNWGVGPAYGWDYGLGYFDLLGSRNRFQTDWGTGRAEVNGQAYARIQGDENRLALPSFGTALWTNSRNAPSYSLALVYGNGNIFSGGPRLAETQDVIDLPTSYWSILRSSGSLIWRTDLPKITAVWPNAERSTAEREDAQLLQGKLELAAQKEVPEKVALLLEVAAHFGLDAEHPRAALYQLLTIPKYAIPALIQRITSDEVDGYLVLRNVFACLGRTGTDALQLATQDLSGTTGALRLGLMSSLPVKDAAPSLEHVFADPDWRLRRAAVATLGNLFDNDAGTIVGRKQFILFLRHLLSHSLRSKEIPPLLMHKTFAELVSLLSLDAQFPAQDKITLFALQEDPFGPLRPGVWPALRKALTRNRIGFAKAWDEELKDLALLHESARQHVIPLLHDSEPEIRMASLIALGQIGDARDLPLIRAALEDPLRTVQEAATMALAKVGKPAHSTIRELSVSRSTRERVLAATIFGWTADPALFKMWKHLLKDADPNVREAALVSLRTSYELIAQENSFLKKQVQKRLRKEPTGPLHNLALSVLDSLP